MPNIGAPELIIILVIALLILGPGKLPEVGASLGKSIREFRKASTDLQESVNVNVDTSPLPATPVAAAPVAAAAVAPAPVAPAAPIEPAPVAPVAPVDVPAGGLADGPTAPAPAAPGSDSSTVAS
jgi:TatA/E family protein of Tat protein translocase